MGRLSRSEGKPRQTMRVYKHGSVANRDASELVWVHLRGEECLMRNTSTTAGSPA